MNQEYFIVKMTIPEVQLLSDLLYIEKAHTIRSIINSEADNEKKFLGIMEINDLSFNFDKYLENLFFQIKSLNTDNTEVVIPKAHATVFKTLCTVTVKSGLTPDVQKYWDVDGPGFMSKLALAMEKPLTLEQVKEEAKKYVKATKEEVELGVNVFGKKGLA